MTWCSRVSILCSVSAHWCLPPVRGESLIRVRPTVIQPSPDPNGEVWLIPQANGGFRAQNVTVWQLTRNAYYVRDQQLTGGPAWIRTDRYDISAEPEAVGSEHPEPMPGSDSSGDRMALHKLRTQALLRNRFGLVMRTSTAVKEHYSLKLRESGHTMPAARDRSLLPTARMRDGSLTVSTDSRGLAALLTDLTGKLVVDETRLIDRYEIHLEWTPDDKAESIMAAVREQLGLELEPRSGPVRMFVIERIERPGEPVPTQR